jgi:hypothetical protein
MRNLYRSAIRLITHPTGAFRIRPEINPFAGAKIVPPSPAVKVTGVGAILPNIELPVTLPLAEDVGEILYEIIVTPSVSSIVRMAFVIVPVKTCALAICNNIFME